MSETNNFTITSQGYVCGEGSQAYRENFVSFSMHCMHLYCMYMCAHLCCVCALWKVSNSMVSQV